MKAFRIDSDDNITAYSSRKQAEAEGDGVFTTSGQLEKLMAEAPISRLVEIWNSLPGVLPVKKFENRTKACNRIWKSIQGLGEAEPVKTPPAAPQVAKGRAPRSRSTTEARTTESAHGGKKAEVITMLQKPGGATLQAIMDATGWQAHTTRGFIAGTLKTKMGLQVESFKNEAKERSYRITQ